MFVHLDGRGIRIDSRRGERVIVPGAEFIVKGEGMPKRGKAKGDRGDLYIKFEVEMPSVSWASRTDPQVSLSANVKARLGFADIRDLKSTCRAPCLS